MTNTLGIMLEILSSYRWIRLSVRIIVAIKRQFFHIVTHVFYNRNLLQGIFAIVTRKAVICSFGHGCKHVLTILPTIWRPGFMNFRLYFDETIIFSLEIECKKCWKNSFIIPSGISLLCSWRHVGLILGHGTIK